MPNVPAKTVAAPTPEAIEKTLILGDLKELSPEQRVVYYRNLCESVGLNPLTRPFEYLTLQGKLTLYARKDATEQIRATRGISLSIPSRELIDGAYVVTAEARDATGRTDSATGVVWVDGLKGEARANAMMKAETKAKRRVTLSIAGLGMLDETEVETIPNARPFSEPAGARPAVAAPTVDAESGEVVEPEWMDGRQAETITPEQAAELRASVENAGGPVDPETGDPCLIATILALYKCKTLGDLPAEKLTEVRLRVANYAAKRAAR